jgi:hypothetical protein
MNYMSQFASAMLVLVFAAVMLVVGQLYIENRSAKTPIIRAAQAEGFVARHVGPDRQLTLRLP